MVSKSKAVFEAIWDQDDDRLLAAISEGGDPNAEFEGKPALVWAVEAGRTTVVILLDAGANVNDADSTGTTAISAAAFDGSEEIVSLLIDRGADVRKPDHDGCTPLMNAAKSGSITVVKLLANAGAIVDERDGDHQTALMWAAMRGDYPDLVPVIIAMGADPNAIGGPRQWTPLMMAIALGHTKTAVALLNCGANVDLSNDRGETARGLADASDDPSIKAML